MIKIIFFGDSICTGQNVSIHKGWVTQISQSFEGKAIVLNSSTNGRTTRQAVEDMPYNIQEQCPDILIVQFGMNDCNYWKTDKGVPRVSLKAFEANLEEIISRSLTFKIKKIFLNTNHSTGLNSVIPYTNICYEDSNRKYNSVIRKVTKNNNVILNDIEKEFNNYNGNISELTLSDKIHLSELGHTIYFNTIYPVIERTVMELNK